MPVTDLMRTGLTIRENGPTERERLVICTINNGPSMGETVAGQYARLFVAAPQMADMLRQISEACNHCEEWGDDGDFDHTFMPRLHESNLAAIRRLLGTL
jgi:hypothetical protein